jgi:hypothetical protein
MNRVKVVAARVGTAHYGVPVKGLKDEDGQQLYRLACQGRNARFYARPAEDQLVRVTCQRCGKGAHG